MMNRMLVTAGSAVLALGLLGGTGTAALADDSGYGQRNTGESGRMAEARQLIDMGSWGSAIWSLKQVLKEEPDNADAHNLLAFSYRSVGKYEVAERHYARALEIAPEHRGAHVYLGVLYLETGREPRAREQLETLSQLCGRDCPEYQRLRSAISGSGSS